VAPSRQLSSLLRTVANGAYVAIDFDPAADGRLVDVQASLTDIPLPDRSVAMIVCSHVLEHVPDDRRAMHEMARVLVPDGLLLVLIPWRAGPTDEDPSATESERLRRFGQADHVRYYGDDFEDRLRDAGLEPTVMQPHQVIAPDVLEVTGIAPDEKLWLCRRSGSQILDMGTLAETVGRQATSQLVEALRQVVAREPEPEPPREPGPAPTPESTAHSMYRRLRRTRLGRQSAALLRPLRRGR
jgi:SAM-dependent methyltransferase